MNEETVQGESDAQCENKVSSFNKDKMEEHLLIEKQTGCSSDYHPDIRTGTEVRGELKRVCTFFILLFMHLYIQTFV